MSKSTIQLNDHLYEYLLNVSLREHEVLKELRDETLNLSGSQMQISPDQGQFMAFMVRAIGAKNILEIGTYTGYSALVCALAMNNGRLITLDCDPVITKVAEKYLKKNSSFNEEKDEIEDFEFNQDLEDNDNIRSPGWIRYQKRIK